MKKPVILLLVVSLFFTSFCKNKNQIDVKDKSQPQQGYTVIELFTSEGCSSCPSADRLLEEVNKEYAGKNVLVLAYHVDYWDRLGWKDPFSSAENTQRQNYYANLFQLNSIYTPQVVVNGQKEFVGSDKRQLTNSISSSTKEKIDFKINVAQRDGDKIAISLSDISLKSNETIVIALLQKEASTKVKRGENGGKELHHINIVREFKILTDVKKPIEFSLPEKETTNFFTAAFIQNKITGKVTGFEEVAIK